MKFRFFLLIYPLLTLANPTGERVISGDCSLDRRENRLAITQHSDQAIIEWHDFSIKQNEHTQFDLPSHNSAILNRVTGNQLSKIYGSLKSNGQVFLINPQGILIGPSGKINTHAFFCLHLESSQW